MPPRLALTTALAASVLLGAPGIAHAQRALHADSLRDDRSFSFYDRGPYRAQVPRPEQLLGYELGAMNTQYAAQERVLLAIAEAARDRVHVESFGSTYERRPMRLFIVSAPENIQRLEAIRADLDKLADPRTSSGAELEAIAARVPAVVWISYSVHGNESPGFETAMQHLYQLAASDEPATVDALRNVLVILNPSSNPDGHERFAVWYNSINVAHPEAAAVEHREPWSIQGRYNHYRFDLNRDVIATTQREVQAMVRAMLRWHPMVAIDQHGMTEQYFFPPAATPINENLGPLAGKWMEIIGRGNAAAFDRYGWTYYVRDIFDLYYPGYWDVWPSLTGATGMTYETDGGGWKGILWRREDGSLLSFRDGIVKHYVAGLATIETVAAHRADRVRDYLRFRQSAIADGRTGTMKRIVLLPGADPARAAELVSALLRSGVEVRRASAAFSSSRAHSFSDGVAQPRRFVEGAYVIDLAQPQGKVAKAILEPAPVLDTEFERRQIERYRRNLRRGKSAVRESYEFYDVTAWSLPVAFGVEAFWTEDVPAVTGQLLGLPATEQAPTALADRDDLEWIAPEATGGVATGRNARTAYLFSPERSGSARLAYALLSEGYRVAVTTEMVQAGGRSWPRGAYIVRVQRNDSTLHGRIDQLARESAVDVVGVSTAYAAEGQFGVGSQAIRGLTTPRIAVVGDEGVSQTSYGALWFAFERRYGIRFMPVSLGFLASGDLSTLDVIIIPDAAAGALRSRMGSSGADHVRRWVEAGGTLITMGGSSAWAAGEGVKLTSATLVGSEEARDTARSDGASPGVPSGVAAGSAGTRRGMPSRELEEEELPVASPSASNAAPVELPGSNFDVLLDRTHWLTHGYDASRLTVMLSGGNFFALSRAGSNVAVFAPSGPLHRSGFMWPDNTERLLRGTALLVQEPVGRGHLILFANEPMFRGWWRALDKLVLNAVLLGPTF